MAFEQNDMSGALFRNKRKQTGDNKPEYNGPCKVNGVELEMSAWLKEDRNGNKYMSVSFQPKWEAKPKENYRDTAHPVAPEQSDEGDGTPVDDPFAGI